MGESRTSASRTDDEGSPGAIQEDASLRLPAARPQRLWPRRVRDYEAIFNGKVRDAFTVLWIEGRPCHAVSEIAVPCAPRHRRR